MKEDSLWPDFPKEWRAMLPQGGAGTAAWSLLAGDRREASAAMHMDQRTRVGCSRPWLLLWWSSRPQLSSVLGQEKRNV